MYPSLSIIDLARGNEADHVLVCQQVDCHAKLLVRMHRAGSDAADWERVPGDCGVLRVGSSPADLVRAHALAL